GKALRAYQADKCTKKDFDELFDATYLRAWGEKGGTKEVSADAFLTGRVVNPHPKDPAKVQIIIELIDPDSYDAKDECVKREKIFELAVQRDRPLLADLGIAYAVPKARLKDFLSRDLPSSDRDQAAQSDDEDVKDTDRLTPEDFGGMSFVL